MTIQRRRECINANCIAMCSPAEAEFWGDNPSKCPNYRKGNESDNEQPKHFNCKRCGAINQTDVCKYCGSVYEKGDSE